MRITDAQGLMDGEPPISATSSSGITLSDFSAGGHDGVVSRPTLMEYDPTPFRPVRSATLGVAEKAASSRVLTGFGIGLDVLAILGEVALYADLAYVGYREARYQEQVMWQQVAAADAEKVSRIAPGLGDLFGVRRLPGNRIGVGKYDFPGAVCLFIQVQLPGAASGGQRNLPSSQPADPEMAMELAKKSQPVIPTRASWKKDPKQYGNDFHKMVVTNQPKGKYGGGWELWKQNETVGGTSRPDEVWINRDENRLLIVDNYTGGKRDVLTPSGPESNAHFEKGLAYCYEPEILELVRLGYSASYAVGSRPGFLEAKHLH